MDNLKDLITPFSSLSQFTRALLVAVSILIVLILWQIFGGNSLIPTPSRIIASVCKIIDTRDFFDNLFSSLTLTLKGMGISIVISLFICYLSLIPIFKPIAKFIIKCRYLTLTGLIFVFTLITKDGHDLKISLLIFGIVPFFVTSFLSIIDGINIQEYELCKTLRMNNWQALLEIVIIGRLDQVFEVMRQNFAISWMMITMVEGLNWSEGGIGVMLIKANKFLDLGAVFGILLIIFTIGICFDFLLGQLRNWFFPHTKLQVRK